MKTLQDMVNERKSLMQDLGGRGEKLLQENLSSNEEILVKLKGAHGEGFVVTNIRLYVLKWGMVAGNTFGGRVNAYDFNRITGIELKKGMLSGTVEVLTAANQNTQKGFWNSQAAKSDNVISVLRQSFEAFTEGVKIARDLISNHNSSTHGQGVTHNLEEQLLKLTDLKKKGLITEDEFKAKKAKLLGI